MYDVPSGLLKELLHMQIISATACAEQVNGDSEQVNGDSEQVNGDSEQVNGDSK